MKNAKKDFTFEEFNGIIGTLRGEDGCPWDREQTHESIKQNLIEEAYEAVEALDSGDRDKFADELGDVLLQVVFHSEIGRSDGTFTIQDVLNHVSRKMISRHSHIFGDDKADTANEVLDTWEKNKIAEKGLSSYSENLKDVCSYLPALIYAQKIQKKASKIGFDWDNVAPALEKIKEEALELEDALKDAEASRIEEELGDLLFSVVNVSRHLGIDSEQALKKATLKFIDRFSLMEKQALSEGKDIKDMSLSEMDKLWDKIKTNDVI